MVKVLFQFEDTLEARRTLAAAMEDPSWEDTHEHPTLDIGFGMFEHEALLVLVRSMQQHGARVLVVSSKTPKADPDLLVASAVKPAPKVKK